MIPNDPNTLKKMKDLADRNIARGDWGDEVLVPWDPEPKTPEDRQAESLLNRVGSTKIKKSK